MNKATEEGNTATRTTDDSIKQSKHSLRVPPITPCDRRERTGGWGF